MKSKPHVAIVGATGAVGLEMIKTLEKRNFPVGQLTLLASARSAGKTLPFRGHQIPVQELTKNSFAGIDLALFSAGGAISREFAPIAAKAGCVVIDNSSAFRMDDAVPLVIPEINAADLKNHRGIIANPNCTTAITLMALYPLHQAFRVTRIFASSYQAVSGTGAKAIHELKRQVGQVVAGQPVTREVYPHQIAFNVLPQVDVFLPNGYTKEEAKMENEGRKIMHHPAFRASVTCVRVPFTAPIPSPSAPNLKNPLPSPPPAPSSSRPPAWMSWTIPPNTNIPFLLPPRKNIIARSAASAWTVRLTTAFVSGWPAISSSRAPPSTPCKSPKNC